MARGSGKTEAEESAGCRARYEPNLASGASPQHLVLRASVEKVAVAP
jgi:hypothetical protein